MTEAFDRIMEFVKFASDEDKEKLLKACLLERDKRMADAIKDVCDELAGGK